MSRAVQEDLSGLSLGERVSKHLSNFKVWLYNSEDSTIMGSRTAKDWGKLLLYYLVFYLFLSGFTAIFFGVLGFMLPARPFEPTRGICSQEPNALDLCGEGPFFQALDLSAVGSSPTDNKITDEIFQFGLCEPAFVAIPRALSFGGAEPTEQYNVDLKRKGYQQFTDEVDRVFCQKEFNTANNGCTQEDITFKKQILPLIPVKPSADTAPSAATGNSTSSPTSNVADTKEFLAPDEDDFVGIDEKLSGAGPYTSAQPLYTFGEDDEYLTYIVFFRFNKVWNYQPYHVIETNGLEAPIERDIGIECVVSDPCTEGTAKNYKNEDVECDKATASSNNGIKIDVLSNVMTNYGGFPWRGGALNMNFGSMAVTYSKKVPLIEEFTITCTMGVEVKDGNGFSNVGPDGTPVRADAKVISNMNKYGPGRAYTKSTGNQLTILIN